MKIVLRSAIFLLLVFYVFVFYIMVNPKITDAYKEYYILRTTSISPTERKKIIPLEIGKIYSHRDDVIGFDGWSYVEETHRWSEGHSVKIIFRLNRNTKIPQNIVIRLLPLGTQRISWSLNGSPSVDAVIKEEIDLKLILKKSLLRKEENILLFSLPDAHSPGNGDSRILSIALKTFKLQ